MSKWDYEGCAIKPNTEKPCKEQKNDSSRTCSACSTVPCRCEKPRKKMKPSQIRRKQRERERQEKDFPKDKCAWMRKRGIDVFVGCGPPEIHHEPPRSRGGDGTRIILMPQTAHMERHGKGLKWFNETYGYDLEELACKVEAEWKKFGGR